MCLHFKYIADKFSSPDLRSPTIHWSHIQGLLERAKSDVLVLLDCCAAASSAPRRGDTLIEPIGARPRHLESIHSLPL